MRTLSAESAVCLSLEGAFWQLSAHCFSFGLFHNCTALFLKTQTHKDKWWHLLRCCLSVYLTLLTISHEVREPLTVLQHRSDLSLFKIRRRKQHCSSVDSVTHCSSSLPFLWMFPVLSELWFFYSFHTTSVSNLSLRHTRLLIRTHAHTHLHMFTWWQINRTTLQGGYTTHTHARRHTHSLYESPRRSRSISGRLMFH